MEIYYWRNGKREVDFVVKEGLKLNQGLVITEDLEGEETFEDKKIRFIPLWKWLLRE